MARTVGDKESFFLIFTGSSLFAEKFGEMSPKLDPSLNRRHLTIFRDVDASTK
jgi:hypothetical protein